jgi:hypothetical protein
MRITIEILGHWIIIAATMKSFVCFLMFMFAIAVVPAFADGDVTLFGAAQHEGKLTTSTASATATTTSNFNPGTFGTFGIRIGHVKKVVGGEGTFAYSPNFIDANAKALILASNLVLQIPTPKVQPYATVGMGTFFTYGTDSAGRPAFGKIGSKFALNYGGGLKIMPAGPVGLRFDIRDYAIPSASFNVSAATLANPLATVKSASQTLNVLETGIGVVFKF